MEGQLHTRIIESYLGNRMLHLCDVTQREPITMEITCSVPQGSVLGPLLWNVTYDAVFGLLLSRETVTIGYVNDTLVERDTVETLQNFVNAVLVTVAGHDRELSLRLVVGKTETAVFTSHHGTSELRIHLKGETIRLRESLKYLEVVLSYKGSIFSAHLRVASEKAQRVMSTLIGAHVEHWRFSEVPCDIYSRVLYIQ